MPLLKGYSKSVISENIKRMRKEGMTESQATAIAHNLAAASKPKKASAAAKKKTSGAKKKASARKRNSR